MISFFHFYLLKIENHNEKDNIVKYAVENFDAYVSRINPASVPGGEAAYFDMLRELSDAGLEKWIVPA